MHLPNVIKSLETDAEDSTEHNRAESEIGKFGSRKLMYHYNTSI